MADMIRHIEENQDEIFQKIQTQEFRRRDTFHVGTVTKVNSDSTATIRSVREPGMTEVTSMNGDVPYAGANVLVLAGNEKTPAQILGISPWFIGDHGLE